jgi:hypothetical protein
VSLEHGCILTTKWSIYSHPGGQRTLELARRGFCVVGVDVDELLLEVGGCEAAWEDLYPLFAETDPRELEYLREFDAVLSLGGGAFGHFLEREKPPDRRLARLFETVGMELLDVYDEGGKRCAPTEDRQELYVVARF